METEVIKYQDEDIEEGEVSKSIKNNPRILKIVPRNQLTDSDEGYTPLQRPETKPPEASAATIGLAKMEEALEDIEDTISDFVQSSDSSSGSDAIVKAALGDNTKKKKKKRLVQLRVKPLSALQDNRSRFKKYNIWTASLQEESLTENMRGIDVTKCPTADRSVESYDFTLKYRLNGEGGMKRRLSTSGEDCSDSTYYQLNKKLKSGPSKPRKSAKKRLCRRESTSSCDSQNAPRYILDLAVSPDCEPDEIAKDLANKLYEEKDDLLVRVIEVLGKELPIELFKETQRIERDGGMMIMNGMRRRTPGGVFFFLLKHHDGVSAQDKKKIFYDEGKKTVKEKKDISAIKRDQKVEELKKRLNMKQNELPPLSTRAEAMSRLLPDTNATLSNPPPSPVNNAGQENSPEYSAHAINHVSDASPEKTATKTSNALDAGNLTTYDDDFLDMNYDDVDMF